MQDINIWRLPTAGAREQKWLLLQKINPFSDWYVGADT
jgi:hypothetical protein